MKNYFKEHELYQSYTANINNVDNTPNKEEMERLLYLRDNYLNPIREKFGSPIIISSGYRCEKLNKLVGGVNTSNHLYGHAFDLVPQNKNIKGLYDTIQQFLKETNLPFDELIYEKSGNSKWVHFAVRLDNKPNRSKILNIIK